MNGEDNHDSGRWQVVEVIQDLSSTSETSTAGINAEIICPDSGLKYESSPEDEVTVDDPPQISERTVTYRVVHVAPDLQTNDVPASQIVTSSAALVSGQQVAQTIIANPFVATNGGGSPNTDGPFYVMMSHQDVLQASQRALAPRTHQFSPKSKTIRTARDERRRATHNEVERRRRDKINNWIMKLSKIIPDCADEHMSQAQFYSQSKGGILAKACDYIQELRAASSRVPELLKENACLSRDLDLLKQQNEELKKENQFLRAHLQQNGISVTITNS